MKSMKIVKNLLHVLLVGFALLGLTAQAGVEITYIHNDALGSPVAGTDEQGNVKWRSHYRPYGEEVLGERSAFGVRSGYTGHRDDPETGLTYMGARYYSPALGRFMGVDPAGVNESNLHSFNRYAYANNNPYRFFDPDGQLSREAALRQLGLQDPSAGVTNRARQIADGASEFGDAVESTVTDPTNAIPGVGIFGGILKKFGGSFLSKGAKPKLQRIHSDETLNTGSNKASLQAQRERSTEEIIESLKPGASEPLKVKPDGRVFDGNTRIKVLEERGIDVDSLPRTTVD